MPVVKRRRFKTKANKARRLRDEPSEDSSNPEATAAAVPVEEPQDVSKEAGIPVTQIVDGGVAAEQNSDSDDNRPISFCVKRRVEESSADVPKTPQTKRLKEFTNETLVRMGLSTESAKKRRAEEDLSAFKVYEKKRSRRSLSQSMDTQEPGTQSVPDIQPVEGVNVDAVAQGTSPDKTAITDESTIPDTTAIPDEGANPDEGVTPDGNTNPEEVTIPGASTAVPEATQEPFTQSVKESQAPQEPPAQRVGESIIEAESGKFSNLLSFNSRFICKNEY